MRRSAGLTKTDSKGTGRRDDVLKLVLSQESKLWEIGLAYGSRDPGPEA